MTTDKERAEVYRELAAELPTEAYWSRPMLTRKADELDPPKPQWPDGTVAWVTTNSHQRTYLCQWCDTEDNWCIGGPDGDSVPGSVTKVEPLRVLDDDEIALPRAAFDITDGFPRDAERARYYAASLEASGYSVGPRVFRAYADALDAEAGEQ